MKRSGPGVLCDPASWKMAVRGRMIRSGLLFTDRGATWTTGFFGSLVHGIRDVRGHRMGFLASWLPVLPGGLLAS